MDNFDIVNEEKRDAVWNNIVDVVDAQKEEQGAQKAALDYTTGANLRSDMKPFT